MNAQKHRMSLWRPERRRCVTRWQTLPVCVHAGGGTRLRADDAHDPNEDEHNSEEVSLEKGLADEERGCDGIEDDGEASERRDQRCWCVAERREVELRVPRRASTCYVSA